MKRDYNAILDDADSANRNNLVPSQRDLYDQGHPMNLFLKIFVLQANFYWLGDLEKKCVSLEGMLLGNKGCLRGFDVRIAMCYLPPPPSH